MTSLQEELAHFIEWQHEMLQETEAKVTTTSAKSTDYEAE